MTKCLFSDEELIFFEPETDSEGRPTPDFLCECPTCGRFIVSGGVLTIFEGRGSGISKQSRINCAYECNKIKRNDPSKIPFWVIRGEAFSCQKRHQNSTRFIWLEFEIFENELVDHSEKPFVLLDVVAEKLEKKTAFANYKLTPDDYIRSKITDYTEMEHILYFLLQKGWIGSGKVAQLQSSQFAEIRSDFTFCFTTDGWGIVRERKTIINTNKVFIAVKFDWPGKDKASGEEAIKAIQRACEKNGYVANTVSQDHTGNITDQIISEIKKSKFVVAELTYNNRGVYYESGFARGLGREVFHVVHEDHIKGEDADGKKVHFDIEQVMYKKWRTPEELENKLEAWIAGNIGPFEKRT